MMNERSEIKALSSRMVYENRWLRVREDRIVRSNGIEGIYGVVEKSDFAVIIPILNNRMILVEQYRYPVGARFWEFPQGSWEGETISPKMLAKAELEEETGYIADEMVHVGELFEAYGYSNQRFHIFLAKKLVKTNINLDPEETGLISQEFDIHEVEEMIKTSIIKDSVSVAAFGLLHLKGMI
jgi:ADP-ribose pyrophosphatase